MARKLLAVVVALVAASPALAGFHSPSGNIHCLSIPGSRLLCTIGQADYAKTLQARCSGLDWHGWLLGSTGKGQINCSGGILYPGTPHYLNLPYGKSWRQGAFTCVSRATGVTCTTAKGHGLFISRGSWRAW